MTVLSALPARKHVSCCLCFLPDPAELVVSLQTTLQVHHSEQFRRPSVQNWAKRYLYEFNRLVQSFPSTNSNQTVRNSEASHTSNKTLLPTVDGLTFRGVVSVWTSSSVRRTILPSRSISCTRKSEYLSKGEFTQHVNNIRSVTSLDTLQTQHHELRFLDEHLRYLCLMVPLKRGDLFRCSEMPTSDSLRGSCSAGCSLSHVVPTVESVSARKTTLWKQKL